MQLFLLLCYMESFWCIWKFFSNVFFLLIICINFFYILDEYKTPRVRLELTTYRLTAGRAANCAIQEYQCKLIFKSPYEIFLLSKLQQQHILNFSKFMCVLILLSIEYILLIQDSMFLIVNKLLPKVFFILILQWLPNLYFT